MNTFINQSLVFMASSIILVPVFQYLGFGSVLGYLMAGLLVGPHCFGWIQESESIIHFAELGVVLLLFVIGLEIQPRKLWSMRKGLAGLGLFQILGCTLVFWLAGIWAGFESLPSALVGFGLSLSSTAFVLQNLNEKNLLKTAFGHSSFIILLAQDIVAIPALAMIPTLATKSSEKGMDLTALGAFVGIIVVLILAGRYLFPPLFRMIAKTHNKEIFTAVTLFVVLGIASVMLRIGLSAALGAFMAGVLLADSEYRHELEANLDPFKSLLMGLFFIGVGMSVSLELILEKPILILSLTFAYLILKMLAIYSVARFFKQGHDNSKLISINLAQGGEFAFVIFGLLLNLEFISQENFFLLSAIITVSMIFNPLIIMLNDYLNQRFSPLAPEVQYDHVQDESPAVIIAGFGRFGQIFARILRSQNIPFVAMDHDADQIELTRKFGNKVYFGDVSRLDILEAAGIAKAKYFILAIDDMEQSIVTAKLIKDHYPHVKIFARARNRGHVFDFMELEIDHIKRETFDSSILFAGELLKEMGFEKEKVLLLLKRFKEHDEIMLQEQFKVRNDDKSFVSVSKQGQAQLADVLSHDSLTSYIRPPQED